MSDLPVIHGLFNGVKTALTCDGSGALSTTAGGGGGGTTDVDVIAATGLNLDGTANVGVVVNNGTDVPIPVFTTTQGALFQQPHVFRYLDTVGDGTARTTPSAITAAPRPSSASLRRPARSTRFAASSLPSATAAHSTAARTAMASC